MPELRPGYWGEVIVGSFIRDRFGGDWVVSDERDGWLKLTSRAGEVRTLVRPPHEAECWVWGQTLPEAVQVAADVLGAVVVAEEDRKHWAVALFPPPGSRKQKEARTHLWLMHKIWHKDMKAMEELQEAHEYGHSPEGIRDTNPIRHVHTEGVHF